MCDFKQIPWNRFFRDAVHLVDQVISFRVERTDAGFAELDVTVTSPLGGELPLEIKRVAKEVRKLTSSAQQRISIFLIDGVDIL